MIILKQNLPKLRIYWECFDPVHEFLTGIFKPFAAQYAYGSSLANSVASRLKSSESVNESKERIPHEEGFILKTFSF